MHDIDRTQREMELEGHELEGEHEAMHEHELHEHEAMHEHELHEHEAMHEHEAEHEGEAEHFLFEHFLSEHEGEHEGHELGHESHEHEAEHEGEAFLGNIVSGLFGEAEHEAESTLSEAHETELASELLEVSSEAELEQFLGKLVSGAVRGVRNFARSNAGRMLGGVLKRVAKTALPIAGKAIGGYFGGPLGAQLGGKLGSAATNLFEVELEGLSHEDREFEIARQFVRFGAAAANQAARQTGVPPTRAVRDAVASAARTYAPGLLRRTRGARPAGVPATTDDCSIPTTPAGRSGRWVRRGRNVVLLGYAS